MQKTKKLRNEIQEDTYSRKFEKRGNPKLMLGVTTITFAVWLFCVIDRHFLSLTFSEILLKLRLPHDQILNAMRTDASFLGTAVVTLFSFLASFLVFYYNALGKTNYGISNRKIIGYTIGSYSLPFLVAADAGAVVIMFGGYYFRNFVLFYVMAVYICILLAVLVIHCILSTSKKRGFTTILSTEKQQYHIICESFKSVQLSDQELQSDQDLASFLKEERNVNNTIYHINIILKSGEALTEKLAIIRAMFLVPFVDEKSGSLESKHFYLYHNMQYLVDYLKEHFSESRYIYSALYDNTTTLLNYLKPEKDSESVVTNEDVMIYMGALFQTFLPVLNEKRICNMFTADIYAFFKYILNHIVWEDSLRACILEEYLYCITFLWYQHKLDFNKPGFIDKAAEFIQSIELPSRTPPQQTDNYIENLIYAWLINTTERFETSVVIRRTKDNVQRYGNIPEINYLYQLTWD